MLMNEQDEMLIQRCVDDELSPMETRRLLQRLDAVQDGWKFLASGLLEDRQFRRVFSGDQRRGDVVRAVGPSEKSPVKDKAPHTAERGAVARSVAKHWWSHPVTSLTLCAAIAFVGGMLLPDMRSPITRTERPAPVARAAASGPRNLSPGSRYGFQMEADGHPIEVPAYELAELYEHDRNHPFFQEAGSKAGQPIRWMVVPIENDRSMVFPVTDDESFDMQ
jgi:hypothetical protein